MVSHPVSLILHVRYGYNPLIQKGRVQGRMIRRGILLVLAGIFWIAGASLMYLQIEASATLPAFSQQDALYNFPFAIPGTGLVALEQIRYNGVFLEDGSKEGVSDVVGLILRNDGNQLVEYAFVELWQGQERLSFEINYLPAGEKILVLERDRRRYVCDRISHCIGQETVAEKGISGLVTVRQAEDTMLLVTNPGPLPLQNITVYYKNYDHANAMFLGGIVYEIPIRKLAPGETYFTKPMYYSAKSSRIVKIKTSG